MSETRTEQDGPLHEALARGHEPDPLRVRPLVWFVAGFIAFAVVAHVSIWYVLKRYVNEPRAVDRPRSVARPDPGPPPGAPPLQPSPRHDVVPWQDVAAMHEAEDRVFGAMGWTVEDGRARIPESVVRAVVARGATTPAPTAPPRDGGAK